MIYNDGLYHLEDNGRGTIFLVNTLGQNCKHNPHENRPDIEENVSFTDMETAQRYLNSVNHIPEGGLLTNMN
jgi:hypothetical protein